MLMPDNKSEDEYQVSWEASEYILHEKTAGWFVIFGVSSAIVLFGTYLILKDIVSIVVVAMMAITVVLFANRKPRSLHYTVSDEGIKIDERGYPYSSFKSFSIMSYGAVESVYLEPLERFMPPISIYFAPEDADRIMNVLGTYLPHRDREPDLIDRIVHRIRL